MPLSGLARFDDIGCRDESSSHWDRTPKQSVEQECELRGRPAVVKGCVALLNGKPVDDELILALGGPPAEWVRTGEPSGLLLATCLGRTRTPVRLGRLSTCSGGPSPRRRGVAGQRHGAEGGGASGHRGGGRPGWATSGRLVRPSACVSGSSQEGDQRLNPWRRFSLVKADSADVLTGQELLTVASRWRSQAMTTLDSSRIPAVPDDTILRLALAAHLARYGPVTRPRPITPAQLPGLVPGTGLGAARREPTADRALRAMDAGSPALQAVNRLSTAFHHCRLLPDLRHMASGTWTSPTPQTARASACPDTWSVRPAVHR